RSAAELEVAQVRPDLRETGADQSSQQRDPGGDDRETRRLGVHEPLVQERGIAEPRLEHQTVSDLRPTTQAAQAEGMAQRNRYRDTAGGMNGEVGDGERDRVLAEEHDPVPGSKAEIE